MSGDVQPRKRKDKRRRRDEDEAALSAPAGRSGSTDHSENVAIHLHKEIGTGGHWCAKIIFFALLVALLGAVGIIIVEHRGATDVDTPVSASQWATIFVGLVDDTTATPEGDVDSRDLTEESGEYDHRDDDDYEQDDDNQASLEPPLDHEKNQLDEEEKHQEQSEQEEHEGEEEEEEEDEEEDEDENEDEEKEGETGENEEEEEDEEEENEGPEGIDVIDDYSEDTDMDADIDDGYFESHDQAVDEVEPQQDNTISEEDLDENHSKQEGNDDYVERPFDYASTEKGA